MTSRTRDFAHRRHVDASLPLDALHGLGFLAGGGDMGARIRAHEWSATSFGDPSTWPQSLRSAASMCINAQSVSAIYWGPEFGLLYNDGYRPFLDARHPGALGRPMAETWPTLWQGLRATAQAVLDTGEGFVAQNQRLMMERGNGIEETFWYYSFTPIRGESGVVDGIFLTALDTTGQALAERDLKAQRERLHALFQQAPGFMTMLRGPEHVFELTNAAYMQLVGHRDVLGKPLREAMPDIAGQGFYELLDRVYATGEPFVGHAMAVTLQRTPGAVTEQRFVDLVYQPVTGPDGIVNGIFVEGSDVTDRVTAEEALRLLNATLQDRVAEEVAGRGMLSDIIEGTDVMVMACDLDHRILAVNRANADEFERIYGVRPKPGDNMLHLLDGLPEHRDEVRSAWVRGLAGEEFTVIAEYGDPDRAGRALSSRTGPFVTSRISGSAATSSSAT
jgi:PAS domain S-box-containing protein